MEGVAGVDVVDVVDERRVGQQVGVGVDALDGVFEDQFHGASALLLGENGAFAPANNGLSCQ